MSSYDERLSGLLVIGIPRRIAAVIAFRPELVGELGTVANIVMNPGTFAVEQFALSKGLPEEKNPVRTRKKCAYFKVLFKALVEENGRQRKKDGSFKKGKNAKTVLSAAHKKARRMTKK